MKSKFTISNVLRTSWSTLLSQIWILAGLLIGYILLSFILSAIGTTLSSSGTGTFLINLLGLVISLIFMLGYTKNAFQALDGDEPRFSAYGQQARKILTYFVASILGGLAYLILAGILLVPYFYLLSAGKGLSFGVNHLPVLPDITPALIAAITGALILLIPALYVCIRLLFYRAFIVEDNAGIYESLKKSWKITKGHVLPLFLLGLLQCAICIAGLLALLVGIFVAIPLTTVMYCYVFRKLNTGSSPSDSPSLPMY